MKHKRPPIPAIVIIGLAILVGGYFSIRALVDKGSTALSASGSIEAIEVIISPEIGGKVVEISVEEGTPVKTGDVLFRLDDTLLQRQRAVAAASLELAQAAAKTGEATLAAAQANYDLAVNLAHQESASSRISSWREVYPAEYSLPGGYFSHKEDIAAAQAEVDAAKANFQEKQDHLVALLSDPGNLEFVNSEIRLDNARATLIVAQDVLSRAKTAQNTGLRDWAQSAYDAAKKEVEDAQSVYDGLKDAEGAKNIISARHELAATQERAESAQDRWLVLQTGENSPKLAAARAVLHQAQAAAEQAGQSITQAQASLALIDAQITKLTVLAPVDGTILTRSIQLGEIVAPSSSAMTLGRLDNLTITVYVPEDRYGVLYIGQTATVLVDSFSTETFSAKLVQIAEQAEFTPRNIQTVEGRTSTVFAIKLQVLDPQGKLKPGMPADVTFNP